MEEMENVYTGKTVDEAVEEALRQLGITAEEAEVTVLEEGKRTRRKLYRRTFEDTQNSRL